MKFKHRIRTAAMAALSIAFVLSSCKKDPKPDLVDPQNQDKLGGLLIDQSSADIPYDISLVGTGNAPSKVDLSDKLPPVGNQGSYGTCVGWSTAYYIRTAMQAIRQNLSYGHLQDPAYQFSPKDLFLSVPSEFRGDDCDGVVYDKALQQLIDRGVATLATVPYQNLGDCSSLPAASWTTEANTYRIDSYREVPADIEAMQIKLAEDHPLMIVSSPTEAFRAWKGSGVMKAEDILTGPALFSHALTVVGYDDAKNAFRIVNSWGTGWGDNGFAWVDYDLMINPNFNAGGVVLYDKPVDPDEPTTPPSGVSNLAATLLHDVDDVNNSDDTYRRIEFSVANTTSQPVSASGDWNIYYLYYDAFDANRYGVLLDMYVSDDYGYYGETGYYANGAGSSYSQWVNNDMPGYSLLSEQMFGPGNESIYWPYQMPDINGYYYLVMIVDPFNAVEESNESDNYYFITGSTGGPIWFENGVGQGFQSGGSEDRSQAANSRSPVNSGHSNAYRPDEIKSFIKQLKAEGKLPRKAKHAGGTPVTAAK